jgi:hypothetical protein
MMLPLDELDGHEVESYDIPRGMCPRVRRLRSGLEQRRSESARRPARASIARNRARERHARSTALSADCCIGHQPWLVGVTHDRNAA